MNLLEQAKAIPVKHYKKVGQVTQDEFQTIVAYARGEIEAIQLMTALGMNNHGNLAHWVGSRLIRAIRQGWLVEAQENTGNSRRGKR